ncbi:MAG: hypothetical protein ACJ763_16040 [Bdellovibrionia bacterium]
MASTSELKARIPGWGADLDPKNRPAVPKEKTPPNGTGAHWDEPEQQIPNVKILVSTEHKGLTPVFGTSCPPKGLSGMIREFAFKFSEGRKAHWLLLLAADRVDVFEEGIKSILTLSAHNPLSEMGLKTEFRRGGFFSRFGENRTDVRRQKRELFVILGLGAGAVLMNQARKRKAA